MIVRSDKWTVQRLVVGHLMVNCYLAGCSRTHHGVVIDPGSDVDAILGEIERLKLKISAVVNTHGHGDHIGGNGGLVSALGVPLMIGRRDAPMLADPWRNMSAHFGIPVTSPPADRLLGEGDTVACGDVELRVLETPGHSPGGITLVGDGFAFVGDALFEGSVGRTDFPGGDMELQIKMIREKIFPLGDDVLVLPGHGRETKVGEERRSNPFLRV